MERPSQRWVRHNVTELSFSHGGPFHAFLRRAHVIRFDSRDSWREAIFFAALTWLPPALVEAVARLAGARGPSWFNDLSIHVRLLVAIPLFVVAEEMLDRRCVASLRRFESERMVDATGDVLQPILERANRLRVSRSIELGLLAVAVLVGQAALHGRGGWFLRATVVGISRSPGGAVYATFSLPIFLFVFLRLLWRWGIWSWILWCFAKLKLRPIPTHPDLAGGFGYLAEPTRAYGLLALAVGCVLAGAWETEALWSEIKPGVVASEALATLLLVEVVGFAPLLALFPRLRRAHLEGLDEYGDLALRYVRSFRDRWIGARKDEGLLGSSDIQSLADIGHAYDVVRRMRHVPFGGAELGRTAIALLAPMVIPVVTVVPSQEIVRALFRRFLG